MTSQSQQETLYELWWQELEKVRDVAGMLRFLLYFIMFPQRINRLDSIMPALTRNTKDRLKCYLSEIHDYLQLPNKTALLPERLGISNHNLPKFYQNGNPEIHYCPRDDAAVVTKISLHLVFLMRQSVTIN